jgi:4-carboxymuconolactone decarboxylase
MSIRCRAGTSSSSRSTAVSPGSGDDAAHDGDDRWSRGIAAYADQFRIAEQDVFAYMTEMLGERLAREAIHAAGGAWGDDCLSPRDRSLVVVASLVTQGGAERRLRGHMRWALDHGVTRDELEALVALLAVYAGYPRASTASEVLRDELGPDSTTEEPEDD